MTLAFKHGVATLDGGSTQNLRVGGLRLVQARYRWDQVADRIAAVYEELL